MATTKRNIPALRFPEFEGNWVEKSLGEISSTFKSGQGITAEHIKTTGNYPVFGGNGLRGYTETFTHDGTFVLIGRQGALCGNINLSIGKAYISEHAIAVQTNEIANNEWLAQKLDYFNLNKLSESSAQPGLAVNKLLKVKIKLPSILEQQKIASFLTAVDSKIQQLKRKKELLEQYKKGVMQQIFTQQLRFKDDEGNDYPDWEEKKLGEVATFLKGKGISKSDIIEDGELECIRYGELYTHYGEVINEIKSRTDVNRVELILSEANDVIIPASGETQLDIAKASCILKSGVALGGDLNIIKSELNGVFLSYYLNSKKRIDIARLSQGLSVVHLYSSQLRTLILDCPAIDEQEKIANFLCSIDAKIDLVKPQITKAENFKKGLLQQMFV